jgi:hypothetical protein
VTTLRARGALITAALALAACAGPRHFICEARGGPAWREYRSQHFNLFTDAEPEDVAATADRLELLQAQLLEGLTASELEIPGRLRVVALAEDRAFRELAGPHVAGYFSEFLGEPVVVLPVGWTSTSPEIIAHELAHHLSRYLFPRQPRWFSEGLAGHVETLGSSEARTRGRVGAVTVQRAKMLTRESLPTARQLLQWDGELDDEHPGRFHGGSWLLYGWLWNARSAQFSAYQRALSRGDAPDAAWLAAFPEFDPADDRAMVRLDHALRDYLQRGTFLSYPVKARATARLAEVARVPPADVHLLLLGVRHWTPIPKEERDAVTRLELQEALREDPLQPLALTRTVGDPGSLKEALRRSAAAHPDSALGWAILGEALLQPEDLAEQEVVLRTALALEPDSAPLSAMLALNLIRTGRPGDAPSLASHAVDAVPWKPRYLTTLALAEAGLGHCESALEARRRALVLANPVEAQREGQLVRTAELESRCGARQGPSGAPATSGW